MEEMSTDEDGTKGITTTFCKSGKPEIIKHKETWFYLISLKRLFRKKRVQFQKTFYITHYQMTKF